MIAGLLLAAGAARRFGASKLVQPLGGQPLVRWSAEVVQRAVGHAAVVVPPDHAALRDALREVPVRLVVNPEPHRGLGRSIACGVAALPADVEAVVVALADEPALDARWIAAILKRYDERRGEGVAIVASVFRGVRRHPILFDRRVFAELMALDGDRGARDVVERDPSRLALVEFDEPGTADVDTPEDLARLRQDSQFTARLNPTNS